MKKKPVITPKNITISVYLSRELASRLTDKAVLEKRSVSQMAAILIAEKLGEGTVQPA